MWIILSLIYAVTNAFYTCYNDKRRYNGYLLGIIRGFGVSLAVSPLLLTIPLDIKPDYLSILVLQGILIGIYDSHIFFASAKYGGHTGAGFMATSVLMTTFLWWILEFNDLIKLLKNPPYFITLILILSAYSASYWQMMRVRLNIAAEKYLYPAAFALSFMSIATRYIAIHGSTAYSGIIYYLTVSCFISGVYNTIMYIKTKRELQTAFPAMFHIKDALWLILLSTILIAAKTAAMRICQNPGYVVAVLLLSPIITEIMKRHQFVPNQSILQTIILLIGLLLLVQNNYLFQFVNR